MTDKFSVSTTPGSGHIYPINELPIGAIPTDYVMGTENYYTTIPIRTATIFTIVAIISMIVLIGLIMIYAFLRHRTILRADYKGLSKIEGKREQPNVDNLVGESDNGRVNTGIDGTGLSTQARCEGSEDNTRWDVKERRCRCKPPFWGVDCHRESHSQDYLNAGTLDLQFDSTGFPTINEDVIFTETSNPKIVTERLSFPIDDETTCTSYCDEDEDCKAVIWNREMKTCTPVSDINIHSLSRLEWNPGQDGNIFIKKSAISQSIYGRHPLGLENYVILYRGNPHPRQWLVRHKTDGNKLIGDHHILLKKGVVRVIDWIPQHAIHHKDVLGLYSLDPIIKSDFSDLVDEARTGTNPRLYVNESFSKPELPVTWAGKRIFVIYETQ